MTMLHKQDVYNLLDNRHISYEVTDHVPLFSSEDELDIEFPYPNRDAKNLFIRDHKREHYYMITVPGHKRVDLKQFRKDYGLKKISFASAEELWDILRIKAGHVSPFCLLHDEDCCVEWLLDRDFTAGLIGIHPNENDATVWIDGAQLIDIIKEHGTSISYIDVL